MKRIFILLISLFILTALVYAKEAEPKNEDSSTNPPRCFKIISGESVCTIKEQDNKHKFYDPITKQTEDKAYTLIAYLNSNSNPDSFLLKDDTGYYLYDFKTKQFVKQSFDDAIIVYDGIKITHGSFYSDGKTNIVVKKDNKLAILNNELKNLTPYVYDEIIPQSVFLFGTLHVVKQNEKYGALSTDGEIIIPIEHKKLDFHNFEVITEDFNDKKGLYNLRYSSPKIFDNIYDKLEATANGGIIVKKDDKYAVFSYNDANAETEECLPFIYDDIEDFGHLTHKVKKNGKFGIAKHCKVVIPIEYDSISDVGYGVYKLCKNNKCGAYDEDTKRIIKLKYDDIIEASAYKYKTKSGRRTSTHSRYTFKEKVGIFTEAMFILMCTLILPK